jgi:hypothetical protein
VFLKKGKIKGLDGLVVDGGKNRVTHDAVNAVLTALFSLVNFAYSNYFAVHGFESLVEFRVHCISYFKQ